MRLLILPIITLLSGCTTHLPYPERTYTPCSTVSDCSTVIHDVVSNNWQRSADARNGMEVKLLVHITSTGEVKNVRISKPSTSKKFDKSVVEAVYKSSPFTELMGLDPLVFNQNFREVNFIFKPYDLKN